MYVNNINKNSLKSSSDHEILYFLLYVVYEIWSGTGDSMTNEWMNIGGKIKLNEWRLGRTLVRFTVYRWLSKGQRLM